MPLVQQAEDTESSVVRRTRSRVAQETQIVDATIKHQVLETLRLKKWQVEASEQSRSEKSLKKRIKLQIKSPSIKDSLDKKDL